MKDKLVRANSGQTEMPLPCLNKIVKYIEKATAPDSIFLYGSQANGDTNAESDWEIGCLFEDNYKSRSTLKELLEKEFQGSTRKFSVFPFKLADFKNYQPDTPFQKNIYMTVLLSGGAKTLAGAKRVEELPPPPLTKQDFIEDAFFNLGVAFSATQTGDLKTSDKAFCRSCLYATAALVWLKTGKLLYGFNHIYQASLPLDIPPEYRNLIKAAIDIRNGAKAQPNTQNYYKNISYINKYVLSELKK